MRKRRYSYEYIFSSMTSSIWLFYTWRSIYLTGIQFLDSETMRLTVGQGVHAVYDSVGRTTFEKSLNVLRARGFMVVYGLSSGLIPAFDVNRLSGITSSSNKGSLFLTFATLNDYAARREDLLRRGSDVLSWIAEGTLRVRLASTFPLAEAARAHRLLESREVVGKLVLLP